MLRRLLELGSTVSVAAGWTGSQAESLATQRSRRGVDDQEPDLEVS